MLRLQKPMAALVVAVFWAGAAFIACGSEEPEKTPAVAPEQKTADKDNKEIPAKDAAPAAGQNAPEKEVVKLTVEAEADLRGAIKRLSTSGWREAQLALINGGKASIPILIEALGDAANEEAPPPHAYNLGGHLKADAGRAPRQRTVAEVCCELLTTLITCHSSYKGELPAVDQKAWREWWTANAGNITIGTSK